MARVLAEYRLEAVGGFVPVLMHVPDHDPVPEVDRILDGPPMLAFLCCPP
jgi:inosose dehydratase